MAFEIKIWFMVLLISPLANGVPQVPCYFIFGDSLVDNGNNNGLPTSAKVNYSPYGIDMPEGSTGRFSNGRTMVDFIAQLLGFENFIPPFVNASGQDILLGVNYASGGGGILNETGQNLGTVLDMNKQLQNHQQTVSQIGILKGSQQEAADYLSKCLYSVGMGSNDYINNYLMPENYSSSRQYNPHQYAGVLIKQYGQQLRTLYNLGARKVAIFGLGLIGCAPAEIAMHGTNGSACVHKINVDILPFNNCLKLLVDELNRDLNDVHFIYINLFEMALEDPSASGITVANTPCCVVSRLTGLCQPNQVPCSNRSTYSFWDGFHPTEIVSSNLATRSYRAQTPRDAYPIDIRSLAML